MAERKADELKEKIRQTSDYERLKRECECLKRELDVTRREEERNKERQALIADKKKMQEQMALLEKAALLKDEEWRLKLEHEVLFWSGKSWWYQFWPGKY